MIAKIKLSDIQIPAAEWALDSFEYWGNDLIKVTEFDGTYLLMADKKDVVRRFCKHIFEYVRLLQLGKIGGAAPENNPVRIRAYDGLVGKVVRLTGINPLGS
jgi:hypothetical protein